MSTDRLATLLSWTAANNIAIDPRLRIVDRDADVATCIEDHEISLVSGVAVVASAPIPLSSVLIRDIVVSIPKSVVLSVRSCALGLEGRMPEPFMLVGHAAQLALSLAVHNEMLRGLASRWHGYLQSLPIDIIPLALFWGAGDIFPEDRDGDEARAWFAGTEVEKELRTEDGQATLDEIRAYYHTVVTNVLPPESRSTFRGFAHAYSLVSSRAFIVDAYHGLSMVPIADAFNHTTDNHIHLETDFDVCPTCGALSECPHDDSEVPSPPNRAPSSQQVDTCDIVANRFISCENGIEEEVYNTYGAHLSNAALLARYGFLLPANEHDVITFSLSPHDLNCSLLQDVDWDTLADMYRSLLQAWSASRTSLLAENSLLLFTSNLRLDNDGNGDANVDMDVCIPTGNKDRTRDIREDLSINGDAQISTHLWLWAVLDSVISQYEPGAGGTRIEDVMPILARVLELQLSVERVVAARRELGEEAEDRELDVDVDLSEHCDRDLQLLGAIARGICTLCECKMANVGKKTPHHYSIARLGELLDQTALENKPKTHLALMEVLAESSILESCGATWTDVYELVQYMCP